MDRKLNSVKPLDPLVLFNVNPNYKIVSFDKNVLIIDDWYEHFEEIQNILSSMPVSIWKTGVNSRNFVDYYDCRTSIPINYYRPIQFKFLNEIVSLISRFFVKQEIKDVIGINSLLEFNFFKHLTNNYSSDYQFFPHKDGEIDDPTYNCLVYFDPVCSGGTAIYPDIEDLKNNEHKNLLIDVSSFKKLHIESKPNRLVIFNGSAFHGGYINNHEKYLDNWRINQILLLKAILNS